MARIKWLPIHQKIIWLIGFMVAWEVLTRVLHVNPLVLPPLSRILRTMIEGAIHGDLLLQLGQSLGLIMLGLVLSLFMAIGMAFLDYNSTWLSSLFGLLSAMLHPLPSIALLPVVILWVGIGLPAVFVIILHAVVWSLFLNVQQGFRTVERDLIEVAKNHGASAGQLFIYVLLPCSLEAIRTGLQIGWSRGWRALINAEMVFGAISALGGMGWYIYEKRAFMDTEGLYSGILVIMCVGIFVEEVLFKRKMVSGH